MQAEDFLLALDIESLLAEKGLVAVWVTNSPKLQRFVIEKLFKQWNLALLSKYFWLKVKSVLSSYAVLELRGQIGTRLFV